MKRAANHEEEKMPLSPTDNSSDIRHNAVSVPRVAIVGTGFVGATTAYALLMSGTVAEIVLIDRDRRRAEGHASDLRNAALFSHNAKVFAGDFSDCYEADVTVIAAGVSQSVSMKSRLDNLQESASILKDIVEVACHKPRMLVVASNPVDVLTYAAWKWSGLPNGRVMGSGTSLDTSRFRRRLAELYNVAAESVHAYILGEHGDSQVAVLSSARIAGMPLEEFCREQALGCDQTTLKNIADETRRAGFEILQAKGATYYGIGAALVRIVRAILRNENAVLTVSGLVPESLRLGEVSLSLPAIINRDGVARVLPVSLNPSERKALETSAEILKGHIARLDRSKVIAAEYNSRQLIREGSDSAQQRDVAGSRRKPLSSPHQPAMHRPIEAPRRPVCTV
jgi:L-lactate dehydrogenase